MAVTAKWYGNGLFGLVSTTAARRIDWDTDSIKVSLHTVTYVPDQDVHDFWNDATNEITGAGYTTGGFVLTTSVPTYDSASNTVRMDANDAQWTSASFTARIAVVYKDTGTPTTSPLLGYVDFGGDETVASGTFTIQWDNTDGVLRIVGA